MGQTQARFDNRGLERPTPIQKQRAQTAGSGAGICGRIAAQRPGNVAEGFKQMDRPAIPLIQKQNTGQAFLIRFGNQQLVANLQPLSSRGR